MLSTFQKRVIRLFFQMPEASGFALAGGAALIFWQVVDRRTRDLDLFAPIDEEIIVAVERFKTVLREEGLGINVIRTSPAFARIIVSDPALEEEVLVEIGHDYRLMEPVATEMGRVLSLQELAADKLLALFGRAEARDFVDVYYLHEKLGIEAILDLAKKKDAGFDHHVLAGRIGRFERLPRSEFTLDDPGYDKLKQFFQQLQARLIDGCLGGDGGSGPDGP